MAHWEIVYNWMMDNEDAARACAQVSDASTGAFVISGIGSLSWPAEFAAIAALAPDKREPLVKQFYRKHFWEPWCAQLESDELCKRVFDFAVSGGSSAAVRALQQALNALTREGAAQLVDDGDWGPTTLDAANSADPAALIEAFEQARVARYHALASANTAQAHHLSQWLARARR